MGFLSKYSELITLVSIIFTIVTPIVPIIYKIQEQNINSNAPKEKLSLQDYIRIIAITLLSLSIPNVIFVILYIILYMFKLDIEIMMLFCLLAIGLAMLIGLKLLLLTNKHAAEIYIYNKLRNTQYESYMKRYNALIKQQELLNADINLHESSHKFISILEDFDEAPAKRPKVIRSFNLFSHIFIIVWGFSIVPIWTYYEGLNITLKIIIIFIALIPPLLVAYKIVSFQNGRLYLTEFEIKQHKKRYKKQQEKNERNKNTIKTFTFLNYEVRLTKFSKGRQNDEKN